MLKIFNNSDSSKKTVIVSDVDGTLVKGSLVLDHACWLHDEKIFDLGDTADNWKSEPKNEENITALAEAYRHAIRGMSIEDIHAKDFVSDLIEKKPFYSSLDFLHESRKNGIEVLLVSGSPSFLLTPFARTFKFKSKGTLYKRDADGLFTGEVVPMFNATAKRKHVKTLKHLDNSRVVAFGDTSSDIPLFEKADYTVLVAPTAQTIAAVEKVKKIDHILDN